MFAARTEDEIGDHDGNEEDDFDCHHLGKFGGGRCRRVIDEFKGVRGWLADVLGVSAYGPEEQDEEQDPDRDDNAKRAMGVEVMLDKHGATPATPDVA